MRVILAILAAFVGAFVIVAFTASVLETWATARRPAMMGHYAPDQRPYGQDLAATGVAPAALADR